MNKEIYHEGWLTKSPPTNRIWRGARWRRRWFTLKQGELPGQFFLEYYTDRNCRKLKGTIDLDQCEQVDAGLHLEKGKLKFQHMFDVKTPRRTYYLAADSENDMKEWVNCICQVCALQDLSQSENKNYYNINPGTIQNEMTLVYSPDRSNDTQITELNSTINNEMTSLSLDKSTYHTVNNKNLSTAQQTTSKTASSITPGSCYNDFYNKELLLCKVTLQHQQPKGTNPFAATLQNSEGYTNFNMSNRHNTIERSQGIQRPIHEITGHTRTQSLSESKNDTMSLTTKTINKQDVGNLTGTVKKIPKSLMLTDRTNFVQENSEPSPSLSTCSGPYIPISECYSGSPVYHNNNSPTTPLNSLDPKFYDTPRSHINIGLNLTDQPYSPKRNNCQQQARPRSGRSSPTDSESVFTDDEWTHPMSMGTNTLDRNLRPSDSSVENDSIGLVLYTQRFSKIPTEILNSQKQKNIVSNITAPPRPPKRISGLVLDGIEYRNKDTQSDTENASPAIGPKEVNSSVEQSYDIPRSHQPPYFSTNNINSHTSISPTLITTHDIIASSTPNLIINDNISSRTLQRNHFYTNAAPSKIERNVFRYDFMEQTSQAPAPIVDRTLKPKIVLDGKPIASDQHPSNFVEYSNKQLLTNGSVQKSPILTKLQPPPLDRKPKPTTPRFDTNSLRRKGGPITSFSSSIDGGEEFYGTFVDDSQISIYEQNNKFGTMSTGISPTTPSKSDDKLQYCDLDHTTSSPQKLTALNKQNIVTSGPGLINNNIINNNNNNNVTLNNVIANNGNNNSALRPVNDRGVVYKTVDFLKTEAFNRTRQDAEENRKNNK